MGHGDQVLYYHSGSEKSVIGLAKVIRTAFADPTAREGDWSAVELKAGRPLTKPVTLAVIKKDPILNGMPLVRNSRLSVSPLSEKQFRRLLKLSGTVGVNP